MPNVYMAYLIASLCPLGGDDDSGGMGGGIFWQKKMRSAPFLTPAETKILVPLSASVQRFGVHRMQDFFLHVQSLLRMYVREL